MIFDDLSTLARVLIFLIGPPVATILCWLIGPRLMARKQARARKLSWKEFWALLLAAYLFFGLAIWGRKLFSGNNSGDPSSLIVQ
jgi:hypothetical protein